MIHPSTPRSPQWLFPSGFPTKTLYTPSPHPYAPHAQPISFFSILSPAQYWVRSTDHLAPGYAIPSIPPLPRPSYVIILGLIIKNTIEKTNRKTNKINRTIFKSPNIQGVS